MQAKVIANFPRVVSLHMIYAYMSYHIDIMLNYVVLIQCNEYYCNYNDNLMI